MCTAVITLRGRVCGAGIFLKRAGSPIAYAAMSRLCPHVADPVDRPDRTRLRARLLQSFLT